mmetsp:Transcript_109998/g.318012  ORF Transcript_109998/g.318012 Transcript_109998/m.318012 type:complete len:381 (-) Transcript_109998:605-1747(-)
MDHTQGKRVVHHTVQLHWVERVSRIRVPARRPLLRAPLLPPGREGVRHGRGGHSRVGRRLCERGDRGLGLHIGEAAGGELRRGPVLDLRSESGLVDRHGGRVRLWRRALVLLGWRDVDRLPPGEARRADSAVRGWVCCTGGTVSPDDGSAAALGLGGRRPAERRHLGLARGLRLAVRLAGRQPRRRRGALCVVGLSLVDSRGWARRARVAAEGRGHGVSHTPDEALEATGSRFARGRRGLPGRGRRRKATGFGAGFVHHVTLGKRHGRRPPPLELVIFCRCVVVALLRCFNSGLGELIVITVGGGGVGGRLCGRRGGCDGGCGRGVLLLQLVDELALRHLPDPEAEVRVVPVLVGHRGVEIEVVPAPSVQRHVVRRGRRR